MLKQILTARVHPKVEYFLSLFTVPQTGFDLRHLAQKQSRPYCYSSLVYTHTHIHFGPFSGTTWVSRYQKGKNQSGF